MKGGRARCGGRGLGQVDWVGGRGGVTGGKRGGGGALPL